MRPESPVKPVLVRQLIGESLREERVAQARTLREVSRAAQVSLGYLSEVERGQKEASSECGRFRRFGPWPRPPPNGDAGERLRTASSRSNAADSNCVEPVRA